MIDQQRLDGHAPRHGRQRRPGEARCRVAAPRREPGRWPVPAAPGRRTADLPLVALPACLSTLETKLWPGPYPGSSGRWGAPEIIIAAVGHGCAPASSGVSGRAKHADMPALARASRHKRHGSEAAACRATPCTDRLSTRPGAASFSCLPPLPLAVAPGVGGPAALRCLQPARRRTRQWPQAGRVRGKTPARWTAAPDVARGAARMRPRCTRDDTAAATGTTCSMARREARQRAANRRPSWACLQPDRVRDADHGGCADRPK